MDFVNVLLCKVYYSNGGGDSGVSELLFALPIVHEELEFAVQTSCFEITIENFDFLCFGILYVIRVHGK